MDGGGCEGWIQEVNIPSLVSDELGGDYIS